MDADLKCLSGAGETVANHKGYDIHRLPLALHLLQTPVDCCIRSLVSSRLPILLFRGCLLPHLDLPFWYLAERFSTDTDVDSYAYYSWTTPDLDHSFLWWYQETTHRIHHLKPPHYRHFSHLQYGPFWSFWGFLSTFETFYWIISVVVSFYIKKRRLT